MNGYGCASVCGIVEIENVIFFNRSENERFFGSIGEEFLARKGSGKHAAVNGFSYFNNGCGAAGDLGHHFCFGNNDFLAREFLGIENILNGI